MTIDTNDVTFYIINNLTDGDVDLIGYHLISCYKDGALGRTIDIDSLVVLGYWEGNELLTAHGEVTQRVVLHIGCKLASHLSGHTDMGHMVLLHILVHGRQVEPDVVGDNANISSNG